MEGDHASICKFEFDEADHFFPVERGIKNLIRAKPKEIGKYLAIT